ncbi:MAG: FapA family protein [Candidatus Omnitrophota bacterium]
MNIQNDSLSHTGAERETSTGNMLERALACMRDCASELRENLAARSDAILFLAKLEDLLAFLGQLESWRGRISVQRLQESAFSILRHLNRWMQEMAKAGIKLESSQNDNGPASLLAKAAICLGPGLMVSPDSLTASVKIPSEFASLWTPARLLASLQRAGIANGIENDAIDRIFKERLFDRWIRTASGKCPVLGNDAEILDCMNLSPSSRPPDDKVKSKKPASNGRFFELVKKTQTILRKTAGSEGEGGKDVYGREIMGAAGMDLNLPEIPYCVPSADGLEIRADVDGCAYCENGVYCVEPAVVIEGNVDYESNDVQTNLAVVVKKDVLSGFSIQSNLDVAVYGVIEGAEVKAGGSLFCRGGIVGGEKSSIQVKKNVYAKHISNARITAGGSVTIKGELIQSSVSAKSVLLTGEKGQIIGGETNAHEDVRAHIIGSESSVKTLIQIEDCSPRLQEEADKLKQSLKERQLRYKKMELAKKALVQACREKTLTAEENDKLKNVQLSALKLAKEIKILEKRLENVNQAILDAEALTPLVLARAKIYPGTSVSIWGKTLTVNEEMGPTVVLFIDGNLMAESFHELARAEGGEV